MGTNKEIWCATLQEQCDSVSLCCWNSFKREKLFLSLPIVMPSNFHIHGRQWPMRRARCRELGSCLKFGFELEGDTRGTRVVDLRPRSVWNHIVSQSRVQRMHFQDCTSNVTMKAILFIPILSCYAYSSGLSVFLSNLLSYPNNFLRSHSPCAAVEVFFQESLLPCFSLTKEL